MMRFFFFTLCATDDLFHESTNETSIGRFILCTLSVATTIDSMNATAA